MQLYVQGLISHAEVIERELSSPAEHTGEHNPSPGTSWGQGNSLSSRFSRSALSEAQQVTLYERGVPSDTFTLILQGKVLIRTGKLVLNEGDKQKGGMRNFASISGKAFECPYP